MTIQVDTREKPKEWERIRAQFDRLGVDYFRSKLWVGDYMDLDNTRLVIDRKKDLAELVGNVTAQHERFRAELVRAQEKGIQIVVLCEHGDGIERLSDVYWWENPRGNITEWKVCNGVAQKVKKYPKATQGPALYTSLNTIATRYGVRFEFCKKSETGWKILEVLGDGR